MCRLTGLHDRQAVSGKVPERCVVQNFGRNKVSHNYSKTSLHTIFIGYPSWLPPWRLGFLTLLIYAKNNFSKGTLFCISHGSNTQPFNQFMFCDISYTSRIILSLIMLKHINKQLNNTLMASTRLESKFSYNSQLLSTTWARTNPCHNCSH